MYIYTFIYISSLSLSIYIYINENSSDPIVTPGILGKPGILFPNGLISALRNYCSRYHDWEDVGSIFVPKIASMGFSDSKIPVTYVRDISLIIWFSIAFQNI